MITIKKIKNDRFIILYLFLSLYIYNKFLKININNITLITIMYKIYIYLIFITLFYIIIIFNFFKKL